MRRVGVLAVLGLAFGGCGASGTPPASLDEVLGRFRAAFEEARVEPIEDLFPGGWAISSFAGETRRSATGAELRRRLEQLFRDRVPVSYRERPRSILSSADDSYVLFAPEWTSMEIGTDRLVVESFRIGIERGLAGGGALPGARWRIREFTVWTR